MLTQFSRTELILGAVATQKLTNARVAVFGIGGVGCAVVEALARAGIGTLDLIDNDTFSLSNLNRQLFATHQTIGQNKVDIAAARITTINPDCNIKTYKTFFLPENANEFDFSAYDYIVDAIDTVTGKIALILEADKTDTPIISAMGTGHQLDPSSLEVTDNSNTSVRPLPHVMSKELKKRGIKKLKVVYSKEQPLIPVPLTDETSTKRTTPGSTPFCPPVAGFIIAAEVIKDLLTKA
ncbi:MAG: tRNA threonylcarbamoyladenosine dehydratase [Alphaproteobacteria bacterium]|nr:tRNA threonylcarbamoyladenosine dehydratase [Alphaproteobacteria bacterium]